jgi:hypothetical protein
LSGTFSHDHSGRDDKGEGLRFQEPFSLPLDGPKAHDPSGRDDKGLGGASRDSNR